MTVRKTFQWMLLILLLATVGGGGYAWWMWQRSDAMLREMILTKIEEKFPGWDVSIDRTHYDWQRRVQIQGVRLHVPDHAEPIISIPEMTITIDRDALVDRQEVIIHKIQIQQPTVHLIRYSSGEWNVQQLPNIPKSEPSDTAAPEIEIQQAIVHLQLQHADGIKAGEMILDNADIKIVPSGKKQFIIQGLTHVNDAGNLVVEGEYNAANKSWSIHGHMKDVTSNGELSSLAFGVAPELREKFSQANASLQNKLVPATPDERGLRRDVELVDAENSRDSSSVIENSKRPSTENEFAKIGVEATVDVEFRFAQWTPDTEPDFAIHVDIKKGEISNPVLPFPLRNLQGSLDWDNEKITLNKLSATNNQTELTILGQAKRTKNAILSRYDLEIKNLQFDKRLRTRIPESSWKLYDSLQPTGFADVHCSFLSDETGKWSIKNFLIEAKGGEVKSTKFPYPVKHIVGYAKQRPGTRYLELSFLGYAGKRPVKMSGYIKNVGPAAEIGFDLRVKEFPVDDTLLSACKPNARKVIKSLRMKGGIDNVHAVFYRPPGLKKKMHMQLVGQFNNAEINYEKFPYPIKNISGQLLFESSTKKWEFRNIIGNHKSTKIGLTGSFVKINEDKPGFLQLTILAKEGRFDNALERALPESVQKAWEQISPTGNLNVRAEIEWTEGQKAVISLPKISISKSSLLLRGFPYALENGSGKFKYENNKLEIISFDATHDETTISTNGFVECPHNERGEWRVRLKELNVNRMTPDRILRRALPADLQEAMESLNPQGKMSLFGMVEFRGTNQPDEPVTAAWDLEFLLPKNKLNAGAVLTNVNGHLFLRGTFDGRQVKLSGQIDFKKADVEGYTFYDIQGPFKLIGKQLVVGSRDALVRTKQTRTEKRIDPLSRITARFVKGIVTLDAAAVIQKETPYRLKVTISRGRLEEFAKLYLPKVVNINGIMNGWIDLRGRGSNKEKMSGHGQMQIDPAALYELPAMAQMLKVLSFTPPDRTAFNYAFADFSIAKQKFYFNTIDLVGDAISFRGNGTIDFDSHLNLDFYSMLPRKRLNIPILGNILGAAGTGWVGIKMRGKINQPVATMTQAPLLDEAMKIFNVPKLLIQPLTPEQLAPLRNGGRQPRKYRLR